VLSIRVTKYYHTTKIRDEKRGTGQTIFTWKPRTAQRPSNTSKSFRP